MRLDEITKRVSIKRKRKSSKMKPQDLKEIHVKEIR